MLKRVLLSLIVAILAGAPAAAQVNANGLSLPATPAALRGDANGVDGRALLDGLFLEEGVRTVCLNTVNATISVNWFWTLQVDPDPSTLTATVVSGTITGSICDSGGWTVTGGSANPSFMSLSATHTGAGSCTDSVDLEGTRAPGGGRANRTWSGQYCFETNCFEHDTTLIALGACP